ncbi:MAG: hypothetical protein C4548_15710 [Desulfobacteraceae bacterium]|nr:MAG: hypothetical protein C4548_15710 [Desulfobacteraceae bacterium]
MGQSIIKISITLFLAVLALWAANYGWLSYNYSKINKIQSIPSEQSLSYFPHSLYEAGLKAWYENDLDTADTLWFRAARANVLLIDAWLGLVQTSIADKNFARAVKILTWTDHLTRDVIKWKWKHILLARELGLGGMFARNINFVISSEPLRADALQLLDISSNRDSRKAMDVLTTDNLPHYLAWLIRWQRTGDALAVWDAMPEIQKTQTLAEIVVDFLVRQKEYHRAADIHQNTGRADETIINPGFEREITGKGFDWRLWEERDLWHIQRARGEGIDGGHAIRITFKGKENIQFYHFRQIVPVEPRKHYRLTFWWRSRDITTDQRPFFEIACPDSRDRYWRTDMIPSTTGWRKESMTFSPPEGCAAVTLRLNRHASRRFDADIAGTMWLDNFILEREERP